MFKIAISGKARTGKNTVSKLLNDHIYGGAVQIAFADPIKLMAEVMFPRLDKEYLYGKSELRSRAIPGAFKDGEPLTVRQLLIDIGTGLGRAYKESIWLDAFDFNLEQARAKNKSVIVTDVRFRNEFDHLKKLGFFQIRIVRDEHLEINHISETGQDSIKNEEFDYIIQNNSTLNSLDKKVDQAYSIISSK